MPPARPARKSISISLNKKNQSQSSDSESAATTIETEKTALNEPYTEDALINAWKSYAAEIPKIVSVVSYIKNTIPAKTDENQYELSCSNIFQENELKKLLPGLAEFVRNKVRNNNVQFSTKIIQAAEIQRSANPEEVFSNMVKQNPALGILKNNLNLEID